MRRVAFLSAAFLFGGTAYCLAEILFRGCTHPSMLLLGGLCFLFIGHLSGTCLPFPAKMALSSLFVTAAELLCGLLVNRALGMDVWDYSSLPCNLWGQVCVTYSAAWCLLSVPAMGLYRVLSRAWNRPCVPGKKPQPDAHCSYPQMAFSMTSKRAATAFFK